MGAGKHCGGLRGFVFEEPDTKFARVDATRLEAILKLRMQRVEGFAHSLRIRFQSGSRSRLIASKGIREAPRRTSRLPAESSATALDVQLTDWTAYFASIACASHNWLSGQVTLPWFKSSDFAAAESSL
jgi:hypothetical protein